MLREMKSAPADERAVNRSDARCGGAALWDGGGDDDDAGTDCSRVDTFDTWARGLASTAAGGGAAVDCGGATAERRRDRRNEAGDSGTSAKSLRTAVAKVDHCDTEDCSCVLTSLKSVCVPAPAAEALPPGGALAAAEDGEEARWEACLSRSSP